MNKLCILCKINPPIENSHIVPRFALKRLKKGNPIGSLIHSTNINKVEQDGWKKDYLCNDCEQRFSKLEDCFCKNVYDPFIQKSLNSFSYDLRLMEFSVSLYFRYNQFLIDSIDKNPNRSEITQLLDDFRNRLIACDYQDVYSYLSFHQEVTSLDQGYVAGINTYFFECIDGGMFDYYIDKRHKFWIMFVKMPYLYFVWSGGNLEKFFRNNPEVKNYQIKDSGSYKISASNTCLDHLLKEEFNRRALQIQNGYLTMNDWRLNKIKTKISETKNIEEFRSSYSYNLDMNLLNP